jgi:3-hydroxymyristoyl/3-hydroxydecanoyl-(acyl carrier protein) dehydratase
MLNRDQLLEMLPFGPEALCIDGITTIDEKAGRVEGWRDVTDEDCAGHLPGLPRLAGSRMLEMALQVAAVLYALHKEFGMLIKVENFTVLSPVLPGQRLLIKTFQTIRDKKDAYGSIEGWVDDRQVFEGLVWAQIRSILLLRRAQKSTR